ncbi:MAG: lipopolysaccharide biosynthesis protein [Chitinophagales bacterium]
MHLKALHPFAMRGFLCINEGRTCNYFYICTHVKITGLLKRIIQSSFLFTLGNMMPLLTSVVLLLPYTTYLSTALYGELALYIAFTLLVQYIANYGLDNYVGIHHYAYKSDDLQLRKFIGSVVTSLLVIGGILTIFFLASGVLLFDFLFRSQLSFFPYGFMSVLTGIFNSFFRTYINFLFYRNQPKKHFGFNLFNFAVTIVLSVGGLMLYPDSIAGPMWGRLLSGVAIFMLALFFFMREYGLYYDKSLLKGLHSFCVPVAGFYILTWALFYLNNYILNAFATAADVGIYDFALKCVLLIEITQTSIAQTLNPRIYDIWTKDKLRASTQDENRLHHVFTLLSVVMISLCILLLPLVVQLLVRNADYYQVFTYLPVLCISFVFRPMYNALFNVAIFYKKTIALPRVLFISSVIQIIAAVLLIQQFGIWGAVWSYVMVKPLQVILFWVEVRTLFAFQFNSYKIIWLPLFYSTFVILIFTVIDVLPMWQNAILQLVVAGGAVAYAFKNELPQIKGLLWK